MVHDKQLFRRGLSLNEGGGLEDYNGMIEAKAKTIKRIMLSAAEAEYVTVFYTADQSFSKHYTWLVHLCIVDKTRNDIVLYGKSTATSI